MAMTLQAATLAAQNGDIVWFAPQFVYDYLDREKASLPGAPFTHATANAIPHGKIDQLSNNLDPPDFTAQWTASVSGKTLPLSRLFASLPLFKAALKTALAARADQAEAIAALDDSYAESVDEIGFPVIGVNLSVLDFGASETSMQFEITNSGEGKLHWEVSADIAKVSFDVDSGDTLDEADVVTVTVDREGIPAGTYNPIVMVSSDGGNVEITLTVVVE